MKIAIRLFFLYLLLGITIVAWTAVDDSMSMHDRKSVVLG